MKYINRHTLLLYAIIILVLLCGCQAETPIDSDNTRPIPTTVPIPTTTPEPNDGRTWIELQTSPYDLTDMRVVWCGSINLLDDNTPEFISLYVRAEKMDNGDFAFDDGQDWALLVESDEGVYPLFGRSFLQLGTVSCLVYRDVEDGEKLHVLVQRLQGAGLEIYDCVYDNEKGAFLREPVFSADNINFFGSSGSPNGEYINVKLSDYNYLLYNLPREDKTEAVTAFEALIKMTSRGEILPDEAVNQFLIFHEELIKGLDVEMQGSEITPEMREEYAKYFIRLYTSEGSLMMATDLAGIGDALEGKVERGYQKYFELAQWQRAEGLEQLVNDAGLVVSWNELADVIVRSQKITDDYPELAMRRGLDSLVWHYQLWYLESRLDNSPNRDKNGLLPEVKASYEYFLETHPDSKWADEVRAVLEKG